MEKFSTPDGKCQKNNDLISGVAFSVRWIYVCTPGMGVNL